MIETTSRPNHSWAAWLTSHGIEPLESAALGLLGITAFFLLATAGLVGEASDAESHLLLSIDSIATTSTSHEVTYGWLLNTAARTLGVSPDLGFARMVSLLCVLASALTAFVGIASWIGVRVGIWAVLLAMLSPASVATAGNAGPDAMMALLAVVAVTGLFGWVHLADGLAVRLVVGLTSVLAAGGLLSMAMAAPPAPPFFRGDAGIPILATTVAMALTMPWGLAGPIAAVLLKDRRSHASILLACGALLAVAAFPMVPLAGAWLATLACAVPAGSAWITALSSLSARRAPAQRWLTGMLVASSGAIVVISVLRIATVFAYMERFQGLATTAAICGTLAIAFHRRADWQALPLAVLAIAVQSIFLFAVQPERNALDWDRAFAHGLRQHIPAGMAVATDWPMSDRFRFHLDRPTAQLSSLHSGFVVYELLPWSPSVDQSVAMGQRELIDAFLWPPKRMVLVRVPRSAPGPGMAQGDGSR